MTPEALAQIKARAEAATSGPWEAIPDPAYGDQGYLLTVGPIWALSGAALDLKVGDADAAFIVAARDDVPALVAEVERLREALTRCSWLAEQADSCSDWEYVGGCLHQIQRETSAALEYTDS